MADVMGMEQGSGDQLSDLIVAAFEREMAQAEATFHQLVNAFRHARNPESLALALQAIEAQIVLSSRIVSASGEATAFDKMLSSYNDKDEVREYSDLLKVFKHPSECILTAAYVLMTNLAPFNWLGRLENKALKPDVLRQIQKSVSDSISNYAGVVESSIFFPEAKLALQEVYLHPLLTANMQLQASPTIDALTQLKPGGDLDQLDLCLGFVGLDAANSNNRLQKVEEITQFVEQYLHTGGDANILLNRLAGHWEDSRLVYAEALLYILASRGMDYGQVLNPMEQLLADVDTGNALAFVQKMMAYVEKTEFMLRLSDSDRVNSRSKFEPVHYQTTVKPDERNYTHVLVEALGRLAGRAAMAWQPEAITAVLAGANQDFKQAFVLGLSLRQWASGQLPSIPIARIHGSRFDHLATRNPELGAEMYLGASVSNPVCGFARATSTGYEIAATALPPQIADKSTITYEDLIKIPNWQELYYFLKWIPETEWSEAAMRMTMGMPVDGGENVVQAGTHIDQIQAQRWRAAFQPFYWELLQADTKHNSTERAAIKVFHTSNPEEWDLLLRDIQTSAAGDGDYDETTYISWLGTIVKFLRELGMTNVTAINNNRNYGTGLVRKAPSRDRSEIKIINAEKLLLIVAQLRRGLVPIMSEIEATIGSKSSSERLKLLTELRAALWLMGPLTDDLIVAMKQMMQGSVTVKKGDGFEQGSPKEKYKKGVPAKVPEDVTFIQGNELDEIYLVVLRRASWQEVVWLGQYIIEAFAQPDPKGINNIRTSSEFVESKRKQRDEGLAKVWYEVSKRLEQPFAVLEQLDCFRPTSSAMDVSNAFAAGAAVRSWELLTKNVDPSIKVHYEQLAAPLQNRATSALNAAAANLHLALRATDKPAARKFAYAIAQINLTQDSAPLLDLMDQKIIPSIPTFMGMDALFNEVFVAADQDSYARQQKIRDLLSQLGASSSSDIVDELLQTLQTGAMPVDAGYLWQVLLAGEMVNHPLLHELSDVIDQRWDDAMHLNHEVSTVLPIENMRKLARAFAEHREKSWDWGSDLNLPLDQTKNLREIVMFFYLMWTVLDSLVKNGETNKSIRAKQELEALDQPWHPEQLVQLMAPAMQTLILDMENNLAAVKPQLDDNQAFDNLDALERGIAYAIMLSDNDATIDSTLTDAGVMQELKPRLQNLLQEYRQWLSKLETRLLAQNERLEQAIFTWQPLGDIDIGGWIDTESLHQAMGGTDTPDIVQIQAVVGGLEEISRLAKPELLPAISDMVPFMLILRQQNVTAFGNWTNNLENKCGAVVKNFSNPLICRRGSQIYHWHDLKDQQPPWPQLHAWAVASAAGEDLATKPMEAELAGLKQQILEQAAGLRRAIQGATVTDVKDKTVTISEWFKRHTNETAELMRQQFEQLALPHRQEPDWFLLQDQVNGQEELSASVEIGMGSILNADALSVQLDQMKMTFNLAQNDSLSLTLAAEQLMHPLQIAYVEAGALQDLLARLQKAVKEIDDRLLGIKQYIARVVSEEKIELARAAASAQVVQNAKQEALARHIAEQQATAALKSRLSEQERRHAAVQEVNEGVFAISLVAANMLQQKAKLSAGFGDGKVTIELHDSHIPPRTIGDVSWGATTWLALDQLQLPLPIPIDDFLALPERDYQSRAEVIFASLRSYQEYLQARSDKQLEIWTQWVRTRAVTEGSTDFNVPLPIQSDALERWAKANQRQLPKWKFGGLDFAQSDKVTITNTDGKELNGLIPISCYLGNSITIEFAFDLGGKLLALNHPNRHYVVSQDLQIHLAEIYGFSDEHQAKLFFMQAYEAWLQAKNIQSAKQLEPELIVDSCDYQLIQKEFERLFGGRIASAARQTESSRQVRQIDPNQPFKPDQMVVELINILERNQLDRRLQHWIQHGIVDAIDRHFIETKMPADTTIVFTDGIVFAESELGEDSVDKVPLPPTANLGAKFDLYSPATITKLRQGIRYRAKVGQDIAASRPGLDKYLIPAADNLVGREVALQNDPSATGFILLWVLVGQENRSGQWVLVRHTMHRPDDVSIRNLEHMRAKLQQAVRPVEVAWDNNIQDAFTVDASLIFRDSAAVLNKVGRARASTNIYHDDEASSNSNNSDETRGNYLVVDYLKHVGYRAVLSTSEVQKLRKTLAKADKIFTANDELPLVSKLSRTKVLMPVNKSYAFELQKLQKSIGELVGTYNAEFLSREFEFRELCKTLYERYVLKNVRDAIEQGISRLVLDIICYGFEYGDVVAAAVEGVETNPEADLSPAQVKELQQRFPDAYQTLLVELERGFTSEYQRDFHQWINLMDFDHFVELQAHDVESIMHNWKNVVEPLLKSKDTD